MESLERDHSCLITIITVVKVEDVTIIVLFLSAETSTEILTWLVTILNLNSVTIDITLSWVTLVLFFSI